MSTAHNSYVLHVRKVSTNLPSKKLAPFRHTEVNFPLPSFFYKYRGHAQWRSWLHRDSDCFSCWASCWQRRVHVSPQQRHKLRWATFPDQVSRPQRTAGLKKMALKARGQTGRAIVVLCRRMRPGESRHYSISIEWLQTYMLPIWIDGFRSPLLIYERDWRLCLDES